MILGGDRYTLMWENRRIYVYMKIIIYTKRNWLSYAYFIKQMTKFEITILTKYNEELLEKANIIIPFGIDSQNDLVNIKKYSDKLLLCNNSEIYDILDDKVMFYHFIKKYELLENTNISLIKTYTKKHKGENIYGEFYIKRKNGAGSYRNKIRKGFIFDLIKKYKRHQIQDVIDIKGVHGVNCLCLNGELISALDFTTPKSIEYNYYTVDNKEFLTPMIDSFTAVCKSIIKKANYSGLIEIEFIESADGKRYLMECNPRLSGNLKCILKNGEVPFIENIIKPYVNILKEKKIKLKIYKGIQETLYLGSHHSPDYNIKDNGVVKFSLPSKESE